MLESRITRRSLVALMAAWSCLPALGAETSSGGLSQLSLLAGSGPGSTADKTVRAFALAAQKLLPNARIDVADEGGAGGRQALNSVFTAGTGGPVLGFVDGSLLYSVLQDSAEAATQFAALNLIGSIGKDRRALFVTKKAGIQTFKDLLGAKTALIVPSVSAVAASHIETLLINSMTGAQLKPVPGYSSADRKLALLSGEANAVVGSIDTFTDLLEQGILVPVLRLNDGGPDAPLATLPTLRSIATGADADLLASLIESIAGADRMVIAQAGLPADIIAQVEQLFSAITADPQFAQSAGVAAAQVAASDHATMAATVGTLIARKDLLGEALKKAIACGNARSSLQTCS